jgi:hypothetical protein
VVDWPFREIWAVDFEYHFWNGGHDDRDGGKPVPVCLVAKELRSGRVVRQWQDEFGPFPPYRLDADALFVAYAANAELSCHTVRGWGQPARVLDLHAEFRCWVNDATATREKGFFKLPRVLSFFGLDSISTTYKTDMIDRILAGPPYTRQERLDILDYCQSDVEGLARLLPHMAALIPDLRHALHRGRYLWPVARMEVRGIPVDVQALTRIRSRWNDIQLDLIKRIDIGFGVYEGRSFRVDRFNAYLARERIPWTRYADGKPILRRQIFREMARLHPQLEPLRELRSSLAELRLNRIGVGVDGRCRTALMPFASKTSRNQPGSASYIFGPAKWIRFFIRPAPGRVLIHRDYSQQEVCIAAAVSGDEALLAACETGDAYIAMAKQFGFVPADATKETHPEVRDVFKTVVLAIQYGMKAPSLALRTGLSQFEAAELLVRLECSYRRFWAYAEQVANEAALFLEVRTPFGWRMRTPPGTNPRTVRNFPMQAGGAEILRAACILGEGRGLELVAPVHDALMCEGLAEDAEDISVALDRTMRDASRAVLRGYELRTDAQVIHHAGRFFDKRGLRMWTEINGLVDRLEAAQRHG